MKYRGKCTINGHRWYYGDLIYTRDAAYIIMQSTNKKKYYSIKVVPLTVAECVDCVDIRGVDIYEGDIIKIRKSDAHSSKQDEEICEVESRYDFLYKLTKYECNTIEVLGNKWDNPQLLELCKKEDKTDDI